LKKFVRLYDEDLREMVMEHYDAKPTQVVSVYTEEVDEDTDEVTPVYYIEVAVND
jgi:hypothetical protein